MYFVSWDVSYNFILYFDLLLFLEPNNITLVFLILIEKHFLSTALQICLLRIVIFH